jgi:hypothetical protein
MEHRNMFRFLCLKLLEVVILGKSLLVAGLAARLKDSSAFRVTYVELPIAAALAIIVPM